MVDSEGRRRRPGGQRLGRDEILNQPFPQSFRGISEPAVRAFLRRVADEFEAMLERHEELVALVDELESRPPEPPPPVEEKDLLTAVGEETARVLRSAKESADEIRRTAEERAAAMVQDAQDEARSLRQESEKFAAERTRAAEEAAAETIREAERLARETQEAAETRAREFQAEAQAEARTELETAKRRAKEIVAEAQATRDRLLQELNRRRETLEGQVDALRVGRDRLLDAYRVVKRTLEEATESLRDADARTPTRRRVSSPALPSYPSPEDGRDDDRDDRDALDVPAEGETMVAGETIHDEAGALEALPEVEVGGDDVPASVEPTEEPAPEPARPARSFALGELDDRSPARDEFGPRAVVRVIAPKVEPVEPVEAAEPEPVEAAEPEPVEAAEAQLDEEAVPAAVVEEAPAQPAEEPEEAPAEEAPSEAVEAGAGGQDVESIFARIRAEQAQAATSDATQGTEDQESEATPSGGGEEPAAASSGDDHTEIAASEAEAEPEPEPEPEPDTPEGALLRRRREALDGLVPDLVRAVKRVVRDEQNLVLEAVRRAKGVPSADDIMPSVEEQDAAFADAGAECLLAGCAAGESAAREFGYAGAPLSGDAALDRASELAGGLARALMDPLRSRMADALGEAAAIEDPDVAERVRARYREWKTKRIEEIVADALAAAFARGLFDVLPADVPLRWITGTTDACPDCADNALEQTPRGGEFPTGHVAPPAHPGCRCLVVPAEFPAAAATG